MKFFAAACSFALATTLGVASAFAVPVLLSAVPNTSPTQGGGTLQLSGAGFGTSGTVAIGSFACAPSVFTDTLISCQIPPGQGTGLPITVTNASGTSNVLTFGYLPPAISGVTPTSATTSGGTQLTISGTNFGTTGSVTINGATCTPTNYTHTQIQCVTPPGQGANATLVVTTGGQSATSTAFSYGAPAINAIIPTHGPTAGGIDLILSGANFGTSGSIAVGGTNCPVTQYSHTQAHCTLPAGQGTALPVVLTSASRSSNSINFDYDGPAITSISPQNGATSGGTALTIGGLNFGTSGTVTVGGATCTPTAYTTSSIVCTLPPGQGANVPVVVTASGQSATSTYSYGAPAINAIVPTHGPTAGGIDLILSGTNFGTSGTITVGGTNCPVTQYSHTQAHCTLPAGQGTALPVVLTSASRSSNSINFDYDGPAIASISPQNGATSGGTALTINGVNFGTSGTVTVGGATCTPTVYTSSSIVCTLPPGQGANVPVVVTASGQSATSTYSYGAPAINAITPHGSATSGGSTITLSGTNFGTSGTVTVGGADCAIVGYSHSAITCTLPAGQGIASVIVTSAGRTARSTYAYGAPVINAVNPATGSSAGGTSITIAGSNFGTSGAVTVGGATCAITNYTHSAIVCTTPAGSGTAVVLVTSAGQTSTPGSFAYVGANGMACSDASECGTGACVDGVCCDSACGGGDPNDCMACSVAAGAASNGHCAARSEGASCSDSNACTQIDTCAAGVCVGFNPVLCTPSSECHAMGTCDPSNGTCSHPLAADGAPCTGGMCMAGVCEATMTDAGNDADAAVDASEDVVDASDAEDVADALDADDAADATDAGDAVDDMLADAADAGDDVNTVDAANDVVATDADASHQGDASTDASADGGDGGMNPGAAGCGCRTANGSSSGPDRRAAFIALALGAALARRRRRAR